MMQFKFKTREEPQYTSEPYYDIFYGGYIDPEDFIEDDSQAAVVRSALTTVSAFLAQAEEAGLIEIT